MITLPRRIGLVPCNACVEECPVNISPLSIIMDMRRYLEQSAAPTPVNAMMTIENNGAPWQYNQQDRLNWKMKINFSKLDGYLLTTCKTNRLVS
jgi:Fe-S oxidoreductase